MQKYVSKNMSHLGLVSGIIDELGIVEIIDNALPNTNGRIVSSGIAVKAMILNGLGFMTKALYLAPQFFADKPVHRLLGQNITPENLNDDTLGRTLDELFDLGVTP